MDSLKTFLRSHIEWILVAIGIILAVIIGWFVIWGVTVLAQDLGLSLSTPPAGYSGKGFDLDGAAKLDLRGLN